MIKLKLLIGVLIFSILHSCSTYKNINYLSPDNLIPCTDTNIVKLNFNNRNYTFNLKTLRGENGRYQLPVINNYRNLTNDTNVVVSLENLNKWNKSVRHIQNKINCIGDSVVFTVPDKLIVSLSKKKTFNDLKITPDVLFSISNDEVYPEYDFYNLTEYSRYFDFNNTFYKKDLNNELASKYWVFIFRKIIRDKTNKCVLVIDTIPLKGSEYVLLLIYPIDGKGNSYVIKDQKIHYSPHKIKSWNLMSNILMSTQQIKQQVDSVTLSVSRSNIMQK